MLDYNTTSSTIKGNKDTEGTIDYWYYNNIELTGYSNYLEDTVWCNDRSIYSLGGWNPVGGNPSQLLNFGGFGRKTGLPQLNCTDPEDRFTVELTTGNGDLDYPVGLLTADEAVLSGKGNTSFLNTGQIWWLITPGYFVNYYMTNVNYNSSGVLNYHIGSNVMYGIRPSISLKKGTTISGGDGTVDNPYIIG